VARALSDALARFANGIYLLWYPVKSAGEARAFAGAVLAAGAKRVVRVTIELEADERGGAKERLAASGLIIVNPPFGFAEEMMAVLAVAAPLLSPTVRSEVRWLAGEND